MDVYLWSHAWVARSRIFGGEANIWFVIEFFGGALRRAASRVSPEAGLVILTLWLNPYWMKMKTAKLIEAVRPAAMPRPDSRPPDEVLVFRWKDGREEAQVAVGSAIF